MVAPIGLRLLELISGLCLAGAIFGCLYLLLAAVFVLSLAHRRSQSRPAASSPEPVTILKPLHGAECGLERRLLSFCDQAYGAPFQVLCGVQDGADPAIGIVEVLAQRGANIELVVDAHRRGRNPKIANLLNMFPRARNGVLVIADSDMEVGPDYLQRIATELQQPRVGAVSCLYHGAAEAGLWARLSALGINSHFLPNTVLALRFGLAKPCFGSTIALRRSTLREIGGFEAFSDVLADDYAMGAAVRREGYDVAIPSWAIAHGCLEDSFAALWGHDLRAARTIKGIDRLGHTGALLTHPFPLALLGIFFGGIEAGIVAALALACRGALCFCVERAFAAGQQPYWLVPVRDLLSFAIHVCSLFGSSVAWRGARYHVSLDGHLTADRHDAPG